MFLIHVFKKPFYLKGVLVNTLEEGLMSEEKNILLNFHGSLADIRVLT